MIAPQSTSFFEFHSHESVPQYDDPIELLVCHHAAPQSSYAIVPGLQSFTMITFSESLDLSILLSLSQRGPF